jgi:hypothetical protein
MGTPELLRSVPRLNDFNVIPFSCFPVLHQYSAVEALADQLNIHHQAEVHHKIRYNEQLHILPQSQSKVVVFDRGKTAVNVALGIRFG